jgi:RHS repeat-associated protein
MMGRQRTLWSMLVVVSLLLGSFVRTDSQSVPLANDQQTTAGANPAAFVANVVTAPPPWCDINPPVIGPNFILMNETITDDALFEATQWIVTGPAFTVSSSGCVSLYAGEYIELKPGTKVVRGGVLQAVVVPRGGSNQAPVLAAINNKTVLLGTTLSFSVSATDANGDKLTFSAVPLPQHATINAATGLLTFTPTALQAGDHMLTFTVSDGILNDSEIIVIRVEAAPSNGVTALTGRVLDTNAFVQNGTEIPVVGAIVSLFGTNCPTCSTTTNSSGQFILSNIPAGERVLDINTASANPAPDGSPYAGFREKVKLISRVDNIVGRPFFLPRIAQESLKTVNPNATTVVNNPALDITLTVPAHTAKGASGTDFTGQLSISEVPGALAPAALPPELRPGLLITIQPVGVTFSTPVPITFPNIDRLTPGSETDIWSLDPTTGTFAVVGKGRVNAAGTLIETVSGGVRAADWHMTLPASGNPNGDPNNPGNESPGCQAQVPTGSQTTVACGNLRVNHALVSHRSFSQSQAVRLIYNSQHADPQPVIISDVTIPMQAAVPPTVSTHLSVGGVDQGTEVFTNTSGLNENVNETIRRVVQFDATSFPTGHYPYQLMLSSNYPQSSVSSIQTGNVLVNNQQDSPFGAGWTLDGLQRLVLDDTGSAVITEGNGSTLAFTFIGNPPTDPSLYWPFDDGANPTEERIVGLNGDIVGATFTSTDLAPKPGNVRALVFNGAGNQVQINDADDLDFGPTSPLSIVLWFKVTAAQGTIHILGKRVGCGSMNYQLARDGQLLHFNSDAGRVNTGRDIRLNSFMHMAVTYDGINTLKVYLDGTEVASNTSYVLQGVNNAPLKIGTSGTCGGTFPGTIDEVQFYRRALSSREVAALAAAQSSSGFVSPPGDFSTLLKNGDGTFTRRLKDGTQINFAASGLHTSTIDRNGRTTTYSYDTTGRLIKITDPAGLMTTLTYSGGLLSSITDPAGRITKLQHDGSRNLIGITDPDNTNRQFTYDARHRMLTQTAKTGELTTYVYNFAGQHTRANRSDGSTRQVSPSQAIGLVNPAGGVGTQGNPAPVVRPGQVVATFTDGNGHVTQFTTDRFGASTSITDSLNRQTTIIRDANSNPTQIARPNNAAAVFTYDTRGNLLTSTEQGKTSESNPAFPAATNFTYEPTFNQVKTITDPLNHTITTNYDSKGNPIEIIDAKGTRTTLRYEDTNCPGQQTSVTSAVGKPEETTTAFAYDPATCNLVRTTDPLGNVTRLHLDSAGNVIQSCDAEGRVTRFRYDAMNRLVKVMDATTIPLDLTCALVPGTGPACPTVGVAAPGVTCYEYDVRGNLRHLIDARGSRTSFEYDSLDRLVKKIDPVGKQETFAYDGNGNLITHTDRKNQTIRFQYDAADQLVKKTLPGNLETTFTYDPVGNQTSVADPDSTLTMTYDALSRLTSASTAGAPNQPDMSLGYIYDKSGNRITMSDPTGQTNYVYDELNRLTSLTNPSSQAVTFAYDSLSRRLQMVFPNGTTANFTYDDASQLLSLINKSGATPFSSFTYTYDKVGNRTVLAEQRSAVTVTLSLSYTYDNLNRLTQATRPLPANPVETFTYDSVGNRLQRDGQTTNAIFDAANRLLQDQQFCYEYDDNGNQTKKTAKVGSACTGAVTTYTYDAESRLIRIDLPSGGVSEYRYDGLGRRIEKNVNGQATRYVYDNEDILFEANATDTILARYTHGPGIDEPLIMERGGPRFFYQADGLGSITDLTNSAGTVVQPYVYDSFGQIVQQSGTVLNPYTYTGREIDPESGLYYYRARFYDPAIGRFISEDPIGFRGGINLFTYVEGNPTNFTDPTGFQVFEDTGCSCSVEDSEEECRKKFEKCDRNKPQPPSSEDLNRKLKDCQNILNENCPQSLFDAFCQVFEIPAPPLSAQCEFDKYIRFTQCVNKVTNDILRSRR